ncbi:hypothetical protein V6N11_079657 [Hibiscus sabdariffa]|uniref:Uncharacterized protein n=2 Tax=Hibiscus sabdariffa TaxID=183260 RepID=A0ABR1ZTS5_9ROSI
MTCLPKKQHRRDEAPLDGIFSASEFADPTMDCDNACPDGDIPVTNHPISYKEVVTGAKSSIEDDLIPLDGDDIELLEDDIQQAFSDGTPTIDFSPRVQDIALKSKEFTLVLKILGRRVGYSTLYNKLLVALGISLRSLPWNMIFHNRAIFRRRSSPSHAPLAPVVENSRYNPIFLDNDNDNLVPTATNQPSTPSSPRRSTLTPNQVVLPTPSPSIPDPAHSDHDQTSDAPNHSNKTKTQGKSPTLIRKSTLVILGSCDMNIMVRKSSPGASSSIKSFKGRSRSSNLNPAKHLAVVLSESAPPVTLMKMQQQNKNAQHLARTNFAPPPDTYVVVSQQSPSHSAMVE